MRSLGPALIAEVTKSASPDRALFNLAEFSHRIGGRTGFLSLLAENPKTLRLMINLFANSQFLTELFLKRPELLDTLIRVDLTRLRKTKETMQKELMDILDGAEDLESKLNAMRRYRAEEFVRIGLHDLGGSLELQQVVEQLSNLAGGCLEGALKLSHQETEKSFGPIQRGRFTILGMGKLGGREIDYNSDLDLIFIYEAAEDIQSAGGKSGSLGAHEYYVRLGQKLITFLSSPTDATSTLREGRAPCFIAGCIPPLSSNQLPPVGTTNSNQSPFCGRRPRPWERCGSRGQRLCL
jgi:glutamate-ammonia-ligase adenylyltransferase